MELTYRGRPARQLRVTSAAATLQVAPGLLTRVIIDEIVDAPTDATSADAETGCLLRLTSSYSGDTLATRLELDDISTEPADPDEFRVHVPPGTRTVEETSATRIHRRRRGHARREGNRGRGAAAEAVNRTAGAVSAALGLLDDLRGHR